jgi:hypothetical protein
MSFEIDNSVFDIYKEVADWMIDNPNIGKTFTIYYPPIKVQCTQCNEPVGINNKNTGKFGGPNTYTCEYCNGNNTIDQVTSDTIKLRIYWENKSWIKIGNLNFADADAMIIGYLSDVNKLQNANEIVLTEQQSKWSFRLASKPFPHGFGKNRYFVAYLKQNP